MIESIKKAFVLSVKALKLFYVVAALNIVSNLINVMTVPAPTDEMSAGKSFFVIVLTVLLALIAVFVAGGSLAYIRDLIKTGSADLAPFIDNGKKYILRLIGVTLLIMLIFLVIGFLLIFITGLMPAALRLIMTLLIILAFIVLGVFFVMPAYALVNSDLGVISAIKRGVELGKKEFLKILGIGAILFLVALVVTLAASMLTGILSLILRPLANYITAIIMAVASAVIAIIVNIAYMDFYLKSA
ncbi:MAG: hypothetical protein ISS26_04695 [Candidatus Omnitrophica bacterium]|nr:hypothetical protein [Candidatus Omnitrophota bacterium]